MHFFVSCEVFFEGLHQIALNGSCRFVIDELNAIDIVDAYSSNNSREGVISLCLCKDEIAFVVSPLNVHILSCILSLCLTKGLYRSTRYEDGQLSLYFSAVWLWWNCARINFDLYYNFAQKLVRMIGKANKRLTYEDIRDRLTFFLMNFEDP